jgi:predicted MFS family arabinose efflux permease
LAERKPDRRRGVVTSVTRVHYAWVVAGVAFLSLVMASGFRSTTGVLLIPLHEEFGWSHETIGLAVALNLLCFGLGAPFAAALIEQVGVRRVVATALGAIAVSALLTLRMTETWQLFLLWGLVNGLATGAVSVPLAAIIANRWFVARRGLVTGLMTASYASGQLVFLPALAWLAGFDWRWAALAIAIVALVLVLPVVLRFMRDRPEDVGLRPYGADEDWEPPPSAGAPAFGAALDALSTAMRSKTFWLLAGTFFVCGATTNGLVSTHLIPAAHDHGITQVTAAGLLALIGVFDVVGTTASGWLTDRYDPRLLLLAYYGLRGVSLLALPLAFDSANAAMLAFVVVYGLDWVATVPPTSALATAYFGQQAGVVFAWIFAAHQLGAATAAWGAGLVRTHTGEYTAAFLAAGVLALVAAVAVLLIRSARGAPAATVPLMS